MDVGKEIGKAMAEAEVRKTEMQSRTEEHVANVEAETSRANAATQAEADKVKATADAEAAKTKATSESATAIAKAGSEEKRVEQEQLTERARIEADKAQAGSREVTIRWVAAPAAVAFFVFLGVVAWKGDLASAGPLLTTATGALTILALLWKVIRRSRSTPTPHG